MITKQDGLWQQREAQFKQQVADGLADIYRRFQSLFACQANDKEIIEACNMYCGQEVVPNVAIFQQYADDNPDFLMGLATLAPSTQKQKLLSEIEDLLTGIMSPLDIKSELGKLRYQNVEQAKARRDQILERQRLSKMSVPAIRKEIVDARPKPHKYMPYDLLPSSSELPTAELVTMLKTGDARKLLRKHGSDQINDRIFNRS